MLNVLKQWFNGRVCLQDLEHTEYCLDVQRHVAGTDLEYGVATFNKMLVLMAFQFNGAYLLHVNSNRQQIKHVEKSHRMLEAHIGNMLCGFFGARLITVKKSYGILQLNRY